jgi:S-formylglutathione hydrolase FrmB
MALIQVNYFSNALVRIVPVNVVLPVDKVDSKRHCYAFPQEPFKTLYLLHGMFGNYMDWITNTRVQRWAEERNLAVVMPSGDNMYYVDSLLALNDCGSFVGEELPQVMRAMFPLSCRREDTFIAGLSMGGFGALRNGFKYAETFGRIAALSSALTVLDPTVPPSPETRQSSGTLTRRLRLIRTTRWHTGSSENELWPVRLKCPSFTWLAEQRMVS